MHLSFAPSTYTYIAAVMVTLGSCIAICIANWSTRRKVGKQLTLWLTPEERSKLLLKLLPCLRKKNRGPYIQELQRLVDARATAITDYATKVSGFSAYYDLITEVEYGWSGYRRFGVKVPRPANWKEVSTYFQPTRDDANRRAAKAIATGDKQAAAELYAMWEGEFIDLMDDFPAMLLVASHK